MVGARGVVFACIVSSAAALYTCGFQSGHDWLVFDSLANADTDTYLRAAATKLAAVALGHDGLRVGDRVQYKNDGVYTTTNVGQGGTIKAVNTDDAGHVVSYTIAVHRRPDVVRPVDEVWPGHLGYCLDRAKGTSIGYHSLSMRNFVGVSDDDGRTMMHGCPRPHHIVVDDKYSRLAAMLVCNVFANADARNYHVGLRAFGVLGRFGIPDTRSSTCPSSLRSVDELLSSDTKNALCWDYVNDVRDILCQMMKPLSSTHPLLKKLLTESVPDFTTRGEDASPPIVVSKKGEGSMCSARLLSIEEQEHMYAPTADQETIIKKRNDMKTTDDPAGLGAKDADFKVSPKFLEPSELEARKSIKLMTIDTDGTSKLKPSTDKTHIPFKTKDEEPEVEVLEKESATSGSSASLSTLSTASSTYLAAQLYRGLGFSEAALDSSAVWLEKKLGNVGYVLAAPLEFVANALGALKYLVAQGIYHAARAYGVCDNRLPMEECVCTVVDPIFLAIQDVMSLPPPADGDNGAITIGFGVHASAHASLAGVGSGVELYVTIHWRLHGEPNWGFEIGVSGGVSASSILGSDVVTAGAHVGTSLSVFLGLHHDQSSWSKGFNLGVNLWARVDLAVTFLFRDTYTDINFETQCSPLTFYGTESIGAAIATNALRMFVWPVNPKCIRGFSISLHVGAETTPTGPEFNVITSFGVGKSMSLVGWKQHGGVHSQLVEHAQTAINAVRSAVSLEEQPAGDLQKALNHLEQDVQLLSAF